MAHFEIPDLDTQSVVPKSDPVREELQQKVRLLEAKMEAKMEIDKEVAELRVADSESKMENKKMIKDKLREKLANQAREKQEAKKAWKAKAMKKAAATEARLKAENAKMQAQLEAAKADMQARLEAEIAELRSKNMRHESDVRNHALQANAMSMRAMQHYAHTSYYGPGQHGVRNQYEPPALHGDANMNAMPYYYGGRHHDERKRPLAYSHHEVQPEHPPQRDYGNRPYAIEYNPADNAAEAPRARAQRQYNPPDDRHLGDLYPYHQQRLLPLRPEQRLTGYPTQRVKQDPYGSDTDCATGDDDSTQS